jgi:hypothetical protein
MGGAFGLVAGIATAYGTCRVVLEKPVHDVDCLGRHRDLG